MTKKWLPTSIAFGLSMALFAWIFQVRIAQGFDNHYGLAILYSLRPSITVPKQAIIIAIDQKTIDWLQKIDVNNPSTVSEEDFLSCLPIGTKKELNEIVGPGSLPRSFQGCLLRQLKKLEYHVVVFDYFFSVEGDEKDKEILADAMDKHKAVALLAKVKRSSGRGFKRWKLLRPAAAFEQNAAGIGAFEVTRDGPVYGYYRKFGFEGLQSLPDLAQNLHRMHIAKKPIDVTEKSEFEYFWLYGPPGSIDSISAGDILRGKNLGDNHAEALTTMAFVGPSDPSEPNFRDTHSSFLRKKSGANISGVELVATAFLNLNENHRLRPLSPVACSAVTILFAFALGFLVRARSRYAMLAAPSAAILYIAAAAFAFSYARIFLPIATPVFVVAPTAFVLAWMVDARFVRALFKKVVPAPAARRMLSKTADHRPEAVSGEATVIFFDLIGSTSIAEQIPPVDFSLLLNNYYDTVTDIVTKNSGFINSFSGDGVMAVYIKSDVGADHAVHACRSAISVVRGIQKLNASNQNNGLPPLHLRVGVNSGGVAEGEVGAHDRFNFSVVGDAVNLANRLEQLGKTLFPDEKDVILVGEITHRLANGQGLRFTDCGFQQIRGRERPEIVYRLLIN